MHLKILKKHLLMHLFCFISILIKRYNLKLTLSIIRLLLLFFKKRKTKSYIRLHFFRKKCSFKNVITKFTIENC